MKIFKAIEITITIIGIVLLIWIAASFIDIATKNHSSDKNYKNYSDWNVIILFENAAREAANND